MAGAQSGRKVLRSGNNQFRTWHCPKVTLFNNNSMFGLNSTIVVLSKKLRSVFMDISIKKLWALLRIS